MPRRGNRGGPATGLLAAAMLFLLGCPRSNPSQAGSPPPAGSTSPTSSGLRITVVDAEERPVPEGRLAMLSRESFDPAGRLRADVPAVCLERLRVIVEDPAASAPATVAISGQGSGTPLTLALSGPANRRSTPPFLLVGDREDAAASASAVLAAPGGRVEIRYRDQVVLEVKVGPSVIHEIPVRLIAVGPGIPSGGDFEKAVDLRLRQANAVWEPFGRRFVRVPGSRIDAFRGLVLVRGRAAGVDSQGRPSRSGIRVEGREILIPCAWRDDGAPLTPKAAARALVEQASHALRAELVDGLAGDREAVVMLWKRRDGTPAEVEALPASNDVAQAVAPLRVDPADGIEVAPTGSTLSLEEAGLLATGKKAVAEGVDLFVVSSLHSLQGRPAFKVFPAGQVSPLVASSAILSWSVLDGSGRYPYALARALGELLLPPTLRPTAEDSLFADPLSESPGVEAHKRISAATGARIAERGRGLSARK